MGQTAYSAAVLADTPDLFWKLDDASGNPVDSSGNGRNATSTASITYQQAGPFQGSSSVALATGGNVTRSSVANVLTNNFSLECWFDPNTIGADNQLIVYNGNSANSGWGLVQKSGGSRFVAYLAGGVAIGANTVGTLLAGWNHLVTVRRAGTWEIWFNGVQDATGGTSLPNTPTTSFLIGGIQLAGNWSNAACYSSALSGARILAHYNAGISADDPEVMLVMGMLGTGRI